jgi:Vitamin K-dependent gamma-carboxylase
VRRLLAALDRHWFAPASLRDLALVRILVFGSQTLLFIVVPGTIVRSVSRQVAQTWTDVAPYQPLPLLKLLLLPFGVARPGATFIAVTLAVAFVAGALATVGLFSRVALLSAALANTLLLLHWFSYGDLHHAEAVMVIALNVLALSPCAEVWSLDAVRRRRAGRASPPDESVFARWPLRLMQWVIALTYLSAAASKLIYGGARWFNGYTMMYHYLSVAQQPGRPIALFMASLPPWVHIVPSVFAVLFELTFVVAVLVPRTAWFFVLAGTLFHFMIYVTMDVAFLQNLVLYSVFVESLRRYWPAALRGPAVRPDRARRGATGPRAPDSVHAA